MAKPNPIIRAWKYLSAWFGAKVDEKADPKIQIQQAIQESQRQHEALTQQAAAVLANQRQVEIQLDRQLGQIETLQAEAKQALVLADRYRAEGDTEKAAEFEQIAQVLASQLVSAETSVEDLKTLHDQSLQAAGHARQAVQDSEARLRRQLTERTKLLTQLEQAKMQESVSRSLQRMSQLGAPSNTPTLDEVRDKIEQRYALALGQADLAKSSVSGRMLEIQRVTADLKGSARLEEIRASLQAEQAAGAITGGPAAPAIDAPNAAAPGVDVSKQAQPEAEPEA